MTQTRAHRLLVRTIAATLATACSGTTGGTQRFSLDLGPAGNNPVRRVEVATLGVEPDANLVQATGTHAWGAFDANDELVLRDSLSASLDRATERLATDPSTPLYLHTRVRRYVVAHSNNAGGVLACVSWCLADGQGTPMFEETFYASSSGRLVTTLGQIKDAVNRAIVERIGRSALSLSSTSPATPLPGRSTPHTFATIEEAADPLPEALFSAFGPIPYAAGRPDWTSVDPQGPAFCGERRP